MMNEESLGELTFKKHFLDELNPPPLLTVSEWADNNRMLPKKTSSEPGKWRTKRTPYLKEIMDVLSHMSPTKEVVFMKAAQIGATECLNNFLGYTIDYNPSTIMVVWPSLPDVKKNSSLRIDPLLESTPCLVNKVYDRNEDSKVKKKNTTLFKDFDGGALIMTGANSASGLRSVPARVLLLDEVDGYPDDVEKEGDPVSLAKARSRTFPRRKIFEISTPTIKGKSKIEKSFKKSDQRYFHVPCPHCNQKQKLEFDNLKYETKEMFEGEKVISAIYYCMACGEGIEEHNKTFMIENGEWIAENEESDIAGFHLNSLYSPIGWMSWIEICQEWVDAQGNYELLMSFNNTVLGLTYEDSGDRPEHEKIYDRREDYDIGSVPSSCFILTMAVDVQGDRLECEVLGHAKNKETFSIEHKVIPGSPQDEETWDMLEAYMGTEFPHESGKSIYIKAVGIDSGYETSRVYSFCKKFDQKRVFALKGDDNIAKAVGIPKPVDVKNEKGKSDRRGLKLWKVGTSFLKSEIYGDLKKEEPLTKEDGYPRGYIHFPMYEMEYFLQLTAEEKKAEKNSKGFSKIVWYKKRDRNEILDLHVYNRAVASIIGINRMNENQVKRLEMNLNLVTQLKKIDNDKKTERSERRRKKRKESSWL